MQNLFTRRNIIIGGILILVLLITAIFLFGFKEGPKSPGEIFRGIFPGGGEAQPPGTTVPPPPETTSIEEILKTQGPRGLPQWTLFQLGQDPVASLVAFGTTTEYHKITAENLGHLFSRSKDTLDQETRISNLLIQQIAQVTWSPKGNKSVAAYYDDNQNLQRFFIEYRGTTTPRTHFLDSTIADAAFSPSGDKIAYIDNANGSNDIFITDTNFKTTQKVAANSIPDFEISWSTQTAIALKTKSSYATESFLYTLSTSGGLFKKIVQGLGLDSVWSADGKRIIYSTVNISQRPQSAKVYELASNKTSDLPFATIAEKCAFGKKNTAIVYCGVPRSFPAGSYPDAWWQGKVSFSDVITIIDTATSQQIISLSTNSDIINPVIFDDDSYLFFRDKNTNMLWALKLVDDTTGMLPQTNQ